MIEHSEISLDYSGNVEPAERRREQNPEARAALASIFNRENAVFNQCVATLGRIETKLDRGIKTFSGADDLFTAQRVLKAEQEKRNRAKSNPLPGCRDLATIFNEEAEIQRWAALGHSVEFQADSGIRTLRMIGGPKMPR